MEDSQPEQSPNTDGKSDDASQVWLHPVISGNDSLEDGEIAEGRFSSISSQTLSQLSQDHPRPRSSSQVNAATPTFSTAELATTLVPAVNPSMTKEDLDRAKSLVLDLLGWGVTPEYLVDCGLSPATIHKIFTDLQLRLPTNLGTLSRLTPFHHSAG